ncbi:MAG: TetR/AcrR family transcriptional regulator [Chlamydiales bacterium]|nr:TetR/AcrR family transcriptional regulator [Chlamydiales bacterium]
MKKPPKRTYNSETRNAQASLTKGRILSAAKKLFQEEGFELVTVEKIAQVAEVSAATIYSLFQSKRGVLHTLMDEALPTDQREALVKEVNPDNSPENRLKIAAKIARQIYDAERTQMNVFRGADVLAPEFKDLENEREQRRYQRQEETIRMMVAEKSLAKGISPTKARDILWAFTGRDMYRMFVIEKAWAPATYEKWLAELLINTLIEPRQ